jgi:putative uncharacterized protein (fragment)
MKEKLLYKLYYFLYFSTKKIVRIILFFYEIFRYPIKNISIWFIVLLFYIIFRNDEIIITGKDMFLMSIGVVSIVTFISNYLEKQTIDIEAKENYYLGFNIKKMRFHDNFWINSFNNVPIKMLFWLIAIIPVIIIFSNGELKFQILIQLSNYIKNNIKFLKSLWMAVFVVNSFYCVAILIECVSLSKSSFSQSYLYKTVYKTDKIYIKYKNEKYYENEFKKLFNIKSIIGYNDNFYSQSERLISYIINRGNTVANNENEIIEYFESAFCSEMLVIDELLEKVYEYNKSKKKWEIFLFNKYLKILHLYHYIKWNILNELEVIPSVLLKIAINDLNNLKDLEINLSSNVKYKEIFYGKYKPNNTLFDREKQEENINIAIIVDSINKIFSSKNFFERVSFNELLKIFKLLHEIDTEVNDSKYFNKIFKIYFNYIIDYNNRDSSLFTKLEDYRNNYIRKTIKGDFLLESHTTFCFNELLRGRNFRCEELEYMLRDLNFIQIVVVLIFNLAYRNRAYKNIMTLDEYKVWESAIEKNYYSYDNSYEVLKNSEIVEDLCNKIKNTNVSHFIYSKFIEWLCQSLFMDFRDEEYKNFENLDYIGVKNNFPIESYTVFRCLLLIDRYNKLNFDDFSEKNKEIIRKKLSSIREILEYKDIYIY